MHQQGVAETVGGLSEQAAGVPDGGEGRIQTAGKGRDRTAGGRLSGLDHMVGDDLDLAHPARRQRGPGFLVFARVAERGFGDGSRQPQVRAEAHGDHQDAVERPVEHFRLVELLAGKEGPERLASQQRPDAGPLQIQGLQRAAAHQAMIQRHAHNGHRPSLGPGPARATPVRSRGGWRPAADGAYRAPGSGSRGQDHGVHR